MGVKGLLSIAHGSPAHWSPIDLRGAVVVVDGNALAMHAYCTGLGGEEEGAGGFGWRASGSYPGFIACITAFLSLLHAHGTAVTVVFDGCVGE